MKETTVHNGLCPLFSWKNADVSRWSAMGKRSALPVLRVCRLALLAIVFVACQSRNAFAANASATVGQSVSLTVTSGGTAPFVYQWYKNSVLISNATAATYSLTTVSLGDSGNYSVVVANSVGSTTSDVAALTVNPVPVAPFITSQPSAKVATAGQGVTFNVSAAGSGTLTYQWKKNGVIISGATANTFTIASTSASDVASYSVLVSNSVGSVTSSSVSLTLFFPQVVSASTTPGWASRDFNGDGNADIVWRNPTTGEAYVGLMSGTSIGAFNYLDSVGAPWVIAGIGDFNGDGKPDVLWRNPVTGDVYVALMNGSTVTSYVYVDSVSAPWVLAGVGDFDGDGKPDLLWHNPTTGAVYAVLMNGTHPVANRYIDSVSAPWEIDAVGDFNGDGKSDIVWHNVATGAVYICVMNGTSVLSYLFVDSVSSPWTVVGAADFNHNGTTDLLWYNANTGDLCVGLLNGCTVVSYQYLGSLGKQWVPKD